MSTEPGIAETIATIDRRIARLQKIRALLTEEFGAAFEMPDASIEGASSVETGERRPTAGRPKSKRRKQTLLEFLREHGPLKRREIVERTGIPAGTISYLLDDKKVFKRLEDGRWTTTAG